MDWWSTAIPSGTQCEVPPPHHHISAIVEELNARKTVVESLPELSTRLGQAEAAPQAQALRIDGLGDCSSSFTSFLSF